MSDERDKAWVVRELEQFAAELDLHADADKGAQGTQLTYLAARARCLKGFVEACTFAVPT